jgi:hypothetical protein
MKSKFYKHAIFYQTDQIKRAMAEAGFRELIVSQTLFGSLNEINEFQPSEEGSDRGSFVVIKAYKKY